MLVWTSLLKHNFYKKYFDLLPISLFLLESVLSIWPNLAFRSSMPFHLEIDTLTSASYKLKLNLKNSKNPELWPSLKVNNRNTRTMYLSLTNVKTSERSGVLNNFEYVTHNCSSVSIADFGQLNISPSRGVIHSLDVITNLDKV